jgi:HAE1 family hydrophobic/amphiphilic exporter-1
LRGTFFKRHPRVAGSGQTAWKDRTVGLGVSRGLAARGSFQYTLQSANVADLIAWSEKMLVAMRALPQIADVASDLLANAPQIKITINRDQAARFGISPQLIDDTLNDAFDPQRCVRATTDHPILYPAEHLPDRSRNFAGITGRVFVLFGGAIAMATSSITVPLPPWVRSS